MTESELKALLAAEQKAALGYQGGQLSSDREKAMDYYNGEPFGNEVEGRSKIVSTDVADTIEWIMPALMKIFTAGDDVVSCQVTNPNSLEEAERLEAGAKQATEYNNHIFYKDNPGFLILYSMFKDCLLLKTGIVKSYAEFTESEEIDEFVDLPDDQFAVASMEKPMDQTGPWELKEHSEAPGPPDPMMGMPTTLHTGVWARTVKRMKICHNPVPPDEFLVSRQAKHDIDACSYVAHHSQKTASDLIEMGIPKSKVDSLASDGPEDWNNEKQARNEGLDEWGGEQSYANANKAMRRIWVTEAYIKVDWDGDGVAEMRRVLHAGTGTTILENDEWDGPRPFSVASPVLVPHRLIGKSVAEFVMDLQLLKSTLWRQILDNLYLINNPQKYIDPGAVNIDDILQPRVGSIIRPPADGVFRPDAIQPIVTPPMVQHTYPMLEYIDTVKENRTGVTAYNQGTDADTLNKTARGISQIMTAAQQRIELIARVLAETGVKRLFHLQNWYIRRYPELAKRWVAGRNGKWVEMDPQTWGEDFDLTINVGLGTGNKDQMLMHLQTIAAIQKEIVLMQQGVQGPLVSAKNIYATCTKMVENSELKNPEEFFTDPEQAQQQPQEPQPDPEQEKIQAQLAADRERMETIEKPKADADLQLKGMDMQLKDKELQMKDKELAMKDKEMALREQEMSHQVNMGHMEMDRMMFDRGAAEDDHSMKQEAAQQKMQGDAVNAEMKAPKPNGKAAQPAGGPIMQILKMLAEGQQQGQQQIAQLIAQGNQQVVAAITAPRQMTTPDGRTYTSQTVN